MIQNQSNNIRAEMRADETCSTFRTKRHGLQKELTVGVNIMPSERGGGSVICKTSAGDRSLVMTGDACLQRRSNGIIPASKASLGGVRGIHSLGL